MEVGKGAVTILNINKITTSIQLEYTTVRFKLRC